jgi:hypothetical protein
MSAQILRGGLPATTSNYEIVKEPRCASVESFQLLPLSAQPYYLDHTTYALYPQP